MAIKRKDVPKLREQLDKLGGSTYMKAAKRMQSAHLWSLEEKLATQLVNARSTAERWEPEYKSAKQQLELAHKRDDLELLDSIITDWKFYPGDPALQRARDHTVELKGREGTQEDNVKKAMASGDAVVLRDALKDWTFPHETETLKEARRMQKQYNEKRRAAAKVFEQRDLPRLRTALAALPLTTTDADMVKARETAQEWEARETATKPVIDKAMADRDVYSLEQALEQIDFTTDEESLIAAVGVLEVWKPKFYKARADIERAKHQNPEKLREALGLWEFSEHDPLVVAARAQLAEAGAAETKLREALESRQVRALTELVDNWKFGGSDVFTEARAALKGFNAKTADLQKAVKMSNLERVESILESLPLDGDGDPVVDSAKAMVDDYRAQKYKLGMAVASGKRDKVVAGIEAWTYNSSDDAVTKAQQFIAEYDDDLAKLTSKIGSKEDPKSISELKQAIDIWPYDVEDACLVPARARVALYNKLVEPIQAAMQAKDMVALESSLEAWEFTKDDGVFQEAMTCMDEFSTQMRVVSAAANAEPCNGPQ
jgi:hypothetical protein